MRKLLLSLIAFGATLFATSCVNELDESVKGKVGQVTFTVDAPELATRVYGDGANATHLMYAVYDETAKGDTDVVAPIVGGVSLMEVGTQVEINAEGKAVVVLDLIDGNSYSVLFWAVNENYKEEATRAFTINWESKTMTMKQTIVGNTEAYDSFYAHVDTFKIDGANTQSITLTRPFAQLNYGSNDFGVAEDLNFVAATSEVTIMNAPTVLDCESGTVSSPADVDIIYSANAIPTGDFFVDSASNKFLAMNYVLVDGKQLFDTNLKVVAVNGKLIENDYNSVPLQRNYRTNVYGSLLTNGADFDVTIEEQFTTPDENVSIWDGESMTVPTLDVQTNTYDIDSASDLAWLAAIVNGTYTETRANDKFESQGYTFKLSTNVNLGGHEWTPIGIGNNRFSGVFDGNGKHINNFKITKRHGGKEQAALIANVAGTTVVKDLTIINASVEYPEDGGDFYAAALIGTAYGNVIIENVEVKNSHISGNNKVAGVLAHDGVVSSLKMKNVVVKNTTIESLNLADGGNVGGLIGLFQGVAKGEEAAPYGEHHIEDCVVKNCTINAVNSTNGPKRSNSKFIGNISSKKNQELYIDRCKIENTDFTEVDSQGNPTTYKSPVVAPYDEMIGGERNGEFLCKIYIDGVLVVGPEKKPANNEIWYTSTDNKIVEPDTFWMSLSNDKFDVDIVSNVWDEEEQMGIITFAGDVTRIPLRAFYKRTNLKTITLPASVTAVSDRAFYGATAIEAFYGKFATPDSRAIIVDKTFISFANGYEVEEYSIPEGVEKIEKGAFYKNKVSTTINIPSSVKTIEYDAFWGSVNLQSITIPDSVESLGSTAFAGSKNLTEVKIGNGVTAIGESTFEDCTNLSKVKLGNKIESIGTNAFNSCPNILEINIPSSVKSIGGYAFYPYSPSGAYKAPTVYIDDLAAWCNINFTDMESTPHIGALYIAGKKVEGELVIPEGVKEIKKYAFCNVHAIKNITLPASVTKIADNAFYQCWGLEKITILGNVEKIGVYSFGFCSNLQSVTLASVKEIANYAFYYCPELREINLPENLETIGNLAFYKCEKLEEIEIPANVTTIGNKVFDSCATLSRVFSKATTPPAAGTTMFASCSSDFKIFVPDSSVDAYKSASGWSSYASRIYSEERLNQPFDNEIWYTAPAKISDSVADKIFKYDENKIHLVSHEWDASTGKGVMKFDGNVGRFHERAFSNVGITSITVPSSLKVIAQYVFQSSTLETITFPFDSQLEVIGVGAFEMTTRLKHIEMPASLKEIGDQAFYQSPSLESVKLNEGLEYIGSGAFMFTALEDVSVPSSVTSMGALNPFGGCKNLERIGGLGKYSNRSLWGTYNDLRGSALTLFTNVDNRNICIAYPAGSPIQYFTPAYLGDVDVAWAAFYDCDNLVEVNIGSNFRNIDQYNFQNCDNLESIDLRNVETIGVSCFSYDPKLQRIDLPKCREIGAYSLCGNKTLEEITFGSSELTALNSVGGSNSALRTITIPRGVQTISGSFNECPSLEAVYCRALVPPTLTESFVGAESMTVYVPYGRAAAYKAAEGWSKFTIEETPVATNEIWYTADWQIQYINASDFGGGGYQSVESNEWNEELGMGFLTFANNIYNIGIGGESIHSDFRENIKSVILPSELSTIEANAFSNSSVERVDITSVGYIGDLAFYDCKSLREIYFHCDVPSFGTDVFYGVSDCKIYVPEEYYWNYYNNLAQYDEETIEIVALPAE
ncbi:MAG: leucine-rich repeat protein [Tidjanibacter sp.]|nr:leucine-rich repeat protein [Tidjanibacter sp.]